MILTRAEERRALHKNTRRAIRIARAMRISVKVSRGLDSNGEWRGARTIWINPRHCSAYVVFHEMGHVLNGHMCCREHCEFAAHGAALAYMKAHGFRVRATDRFRCDAYAGRTARRACGVIEERYGR